MTILYFSATGNGLYLAKQFPGEHYSIPQMIKQERFEFKDDSIGIIVPNYGLCIPPFIQSYLSKVQLKADYIFAIVNYGSMNAGASRQLLQLLQSNGNTVNYLNKIKMVENYIPWYEMQKSINGSTKVDLSKIEGIVSDIKEHKHYHMHTSTLDRFLTWTHVKKYAYSTGIGATKGYSMNDSCTGCGICERVCPMGNVSLIDGKPAFGTSCVSCMSCIQNCPKTAIHHKSEKSNIRYRHPEITLKELIASNQVK